MDVTKQKMSNADYHAHEAVGSSLLKSIHLKSVLHAVSKEFTVSEAMNLGSAVHSLVLEPEVFHDDFAVAPKVDRRTKLGKAEYAEFLENVGNKTVISADTLNTAEEMTFSIRNHPIANSILSNGQAELSFFTNDSETGLQLKCRPDYVNAGALIDLKTTRDASYESFSKQCGSLGYIIQCAYYLDVYNQANETKLKDFFIVAIENTAPYAVACYKIDELQLDAGRKMYRKALNQYASFLEESKTIGTDKAKILYGYPADIVNLQIPYWFFDGIDGE